MPQAPWALVEIFMEPRSNLDRQKLLSAIDKLVVEDAFLWTSIDAENGQITLGGTDEDHLSAKIEILRRIDKVNVNVSQMQVAYRETLNRRQVIDYTHKKQAGGTGQFARVKFVVEPNQTGDGFTFESKVVGGAVPEKLIPSVQKGLNSVLCAGIFAGFPVIDIKVELIDGAYHEIDSSALAFEIASREALREALQRGGSVVLEPLMKVEVASQEEYTGQVIADLHFRNSEIQGQDIRDSANVITAIVPLRAMFGYSNALRLATQGSGTFKIEFDRYVRFPASNNDDPPAAPARALQA